MGLTVDIYKHGGQDFSNGGLSSDHDEVTIVNVSGPYEPTPERPAVLLVAGSRAGIAKVIPAVEHENGQGGWAALSDPGSVGPMMGGCYVASPDSRFATAVEAIVGGRFYGAVPLHDRFETPAEYAAYSD